MDNNENFGQEPVNNTTPNNNYNYNVNGYETPEENSVMSLGDWLITLIVFMIPCVNIIMMFVWAFGSGVNKNKSNFAKAYLIFMAICIVLSIIMFSVIGTALIATLTSYGY